MLDVGDDPPSPPRRTPSLSRSEKDPTELVPQVASLPPPGEETREEDVDVDVERLPFLENIFLMLAMDRRPFLGLLPVAGGVIATVQGGGSFSSLVAVAGLPPNHPPFSAPPFFLGVASWWEETPGGGCRGGW